MVDAKRVWGKMAECGQADVLFSITSYCPDQDWDAELNQ